MDFNTEHDMRKAGPGPGQCWLNDLEAGVIDAMAEACPRLGRIAERVRVRSREYTGVGSYTNFDPSSVPRVGDGTIHSIDATVELPELERGLASVLFFDDQKPVFLELACCAEYWSGQYSTFEVKGVAIRRRGDRQSDFGTWSDVEPNATSIAWSTRLGKGRHSVLTIDQIKSIRAMCQRHRITRLELFGSATSVRFDSDRSDLDFCVDFRPRSAREMANAYFDVLEELRKITGREVDLVLASSISDADFRREYESSREVLYAA